MVKGCIVMMIVVIAREAETQKAIAASLEALGSGVIVLSALGELPEVLKNTPVNGILIELITSTKSTSDEKQATNEMIQFYANARFKFVDHEMRILGHGVTLEQFVYDCKKLKPKTVRKSVRKIRHIALLLSAYGTFETAEKTVTIDISDEGCFVFTSGVWTVGDRVWLRLLDNDAVLTGTVCSWQPWGNNRKMPGIGVQLDASQNYMK